MQEQGRRLWLRVMNWNLCTERVKAGEFEVEKKAPILLGKINVAEDRREKD